MAALKSGKVFAPMTLTGSCDRDLVEMWLEQGLLPQLQAGDVIVMDNASFHHAQTIEELVAAAGCELWYLPAYSPDYNPIELMWSKVKSILRKIEARSNEALLLAIGTALSGVTAKDATHWLAHCGYGFI